MASNIIQCFLRNNLKTDITWHYKWLKFDMLKILCKIIEKFEKIPKIFQILIFLKLENKINQERV